MNDSRLLQVSTGIVLALVSFFLVSPGFPHPDLSSLNYDIRKDTTLGVAALKEWRNSVISERLSAVTAYESAVPESRVDLDPDTLFPRFIRSTELFLTSTSDSSPVEVVRAFITSNPSLFGISGKELSNLSVKLAVTEGKTLLFTSVFMQQMLHGLPVKGAHLKAAVSAQNELVSISSGLLPNPTAPAHPWINSPDAVSEFELTVCGETHAIGSPSRLIYFPLTPVELVPAIELVLEELSSGHLVSEIYDVDGRMLSRESLTHFDGRSNREDPVLSLGDGTQSSKDPFQPPAKQYTYQVYADPHSFVPFDSPSPMTPGHRVPSTRQPSIVPQELVAPWVDEALSPIGWVGVTEETIGNNIDAFVDWDSDMFNLDIPRPKAVDGAFLYSTDLTQAPQVTANASVVNLFYVANWFHDEAMKLGFTEDYGNFQHKNFSGRGVGGDRLIARVQAGADVGYANNAYFGGGMEDGQQARMGFFLYTGPDPDRDSSLDNQIVLHELAHSVFCRLAWGGPLNEGNSDFFALSLLSSPSDDPKGVYPFAGYTAYWFHGSSVGATFFEENYYSGIRRFPYSTQVAVNPLTFHNISHFDADRSSAWVGLVLSPNPSSLHNMGEVWASMLWQVRGNIIDTAGPIGNSIALQLVTDGLKLGPNFPNFVQARDAILLADQIRYGGANRCQIWNGFAARGLGYGAVDVTNPAITDAVNVFETHPSCL